MNRQMDNRRFRNDKNERNDRSDKGGNRPVRTGGNPGASGNARTERPFRTGRPPERTGKPAERTGRPPERTGRPPERSGRPPERTSRPVERTERFEKPVIIERDEKTAGFENEVDKLEGRNSVLEALKSGRSINRIMVAKGEREGSINQIIALAREKHIILQEVDRVKLDNLTSTFAHQGVIAFVAAKDYVEVDDILAIAEASGRPPFLVILDEITDAYNLGSILRTANAAGVHGVIISKRRAIGLTASVAKASAGAIEYMPVARVTNIAQTIEQLKKKNIWVVGTDSSGEKTFFESDLKGPIALVIGSEGEGMGKLIRESCDFTVNIPMLGQISSLNAAVAGAIVIYEILRQRSK